MLQTSSQVEIPEEPMREASPRQMRRVKLQRYQRRWDGLRCGLCYTKMERNGSECFPSLVKASQGIEGTGALYALLGHPEKNG